MEVQDDGGVRYALKTIEVEEGNDNWKREPKFQREVVHENVLVLKDFWKYGETAVLVSELCQEALSDVFGNGFAAQKRFNHNDVARLMNELVSALAAAHSKGVLHRDLKPHNIFLKNGVVKLGDWGLANKVGASTVFAGCPYYFAPEVVGVKAEEFGFAADVFALGTVFFAVIGGGRKCPANGRTMVDWRGFTWEETDWTSADPAEAAFLARMKNVVQRTVVRNQTSRCVNSTRIDFLLTSSAAPHLKRCRS